MGNLGTFSGGGLGFGVAFSLYDRFSATSAKIQNEFIKLEGATESFQSKINASMRTMKIGAGMMLGGALLAAPLAIGVSASMKFNEAMSAVKAVTQATNEDFIKLRDSAMELGKATKYTATEASQGQYFLGMAGYKTNEILAAMPGLLDLAAAGNMELARTSDIVSDTMTAMGLAASRTGYVADIMASTITKSNTDIEQMGEALKYVTATANMLGVTMPELSAMIGMLGDVGIKGSSAGTSLQAMLSRLTISDLTRRGSKGMDMLGLSLDDMKDKFGNLKPVTELIPMIAARVKGLTGNVEQARAATFMFGTEGARAFAAFTKATGKDLKEFANTLNNADGMARKVSEDKMDNLLGDVEKFSGEWETTMIGIGNGIEPLLRPITQLFTKLLGVMGAVMDSKFGKGLVLITGALAGLLLVTGLFVLMQGAVRFAILKSASAFGASTKAKIIETIATQGLTAGLRKMAVAAWASLGPYALIAGALIGLVFVLREVNKMMGEFGAMKKDAFGNYSDPGGILGFFMKLAGIIAGVQEIWSSWNGTTWELSEETSAKLEALGIMETVTAIGTWIVRMIEFVKGFMSELAPVFISIKNIISSVWTFIQTVFINPFIAGLKMLGIPISDNTSGISKWSQAGKMAAKVFAVAFKILEKVVTVILNVLSEKFEVLKLGFKLVGAIIMGVLNGISDKYAAVKDALQSVGKFFGFTDDEEQPTAPAPGSGKGPAPLSAAAMAYSFDPMAKTVFNQSTVNNQQSVDSGPMIFRFEIDGDKVAEKVIDKQQLKNSRR